MRAVLERVLGAKVCVDGNTVGKIGKGFVVFLGVGAGDGEEDITYLANKICGLRIFEDEDNKMNLAPNAVGAEMLVISNFTLFADTTHGFRPSFFGSMEPKRAKEYFGKFVEMCKSKNCFKKIETGIFGADMKVDCECDGPITIIFDTEEVKK
jgi:D-tyrosyl-tRNA(Tyr) deacylase